MSLAPCRSLCLLFLATTFVTAQEPTPRPDPGRFSEEIAAFHGKQPLARGGIVFTGSSSIRLWPNLQLDFLGLPVVNRGFGGSVTNDLIAYFDAVVARHRPKLLVAYTGENDLAMVGLSVREVLEDYQSFCRLVRERLPTTRVIIVSIKPSPSRANKIPQIRELNDILAKWAVDEDWLRFVDCSSGLVGEDQVPELRYFEDDLIHLNASGYTVWKSALEPAVREEWAEANK
ncbi:MAG: GDSL-type esterase/lipase family protein [Akkermansiaceae bacterium]